MTSATSANTAPALPLTQKRRPQLWIQQTVTVDTSSAPPNIFMQPSSPSVNLYKRSTVNRFRKKSNEEKQPQTIKASKAISGKLSELARIAADEDRSKRSGVKHETVPEEDHTGEDRESSANGADQNGVAPPLPSPTKRVTFLERVTGTSSFHNHSFDSTNEEKAERRKQQIQSAPARRVRKSKTLDAVMVSSLDKTSSPRNQVMGFFNQIRTAPSAPWNSSSTSSGLTTDSASSSNSSARPRSFTLGFKTFANFRLPQQQQQEGRKTSRQSLRSIDGKEKRKRTQSYSFRAPTWLNVNRSKTDQNNLLRPDPPVLKPIIRKRSISANNLHLLIMRQTSSEPEIVGSLNRNDNPYQEILSSFTCYDLMPPQGVVVAFDIRYTGRQALQALAKNEVRVALLWDYASGGTVGLLTATDLLRIFADHKIGVSVADDKTQESACSCGEGVLDKPLMVSLYECSRSKKTKRPVASIGCESSLRAAVSLLLGNQYHRLAVINSKAGDVLYFLSKKAVLHFLMHHMSTIPTPAMLRRTLDEVRLGTWRFVKTEDGANLVEKEILCTSLTETLVDVVPKFLTAGVSALPVFDEQQRLIESLAKHDVIYYLTSSGKDIDLKTVTVEEVLRNRTEGFKRWVTCLAEMTLFIALERLIKTRSRRFYVVDSNGAFLAVVTISDVLRFLMA